MGLKVLMNHVNSAEGVRQKAKLMLDKYELPF